MSQNDFTLANQSFPAFRADLNSALQALASNSSGGSAPSTTFANMWWYDTSNNIMYIRNEDNDAWIKFAELDQANDKFVLSGTLQLDDGTVSAPALTFNSDTNMGIYRGGTDILKFVTAGTDAVTITASQQVGIGASSIGGAGTPKAFIKQSSTNYYEGLLVSANANDNVATVGHTGTEAVIGSTYGTSGSFTPLIFKTSNNDRLNIASNGDISFYEDTGSTPKMVWKASDERLGIGNSSPDVPLEVQMTQTGGAPATSGTTQTYGILRLQGTTFTSALDFGTNGGNYAWIQSTDQADLSTNYSLLLNPNGGNLLVGTTSPDDSIDGFKLKSNGQKLTVTRNGAEPLVLNRRTSDGEIVQFRKDNVEVGSIGTTSGDLGIGTGDCGIKFVDQNETIYPANPSSSFANNDATVSLGVSTNRFKDLYLSGGVYLGGTGSANYLQDYEEGTWTATLSQGTCTTANASYTKIGKRVHVSAQLNTFSDRSSPSSVEIQGLPFARDTSKDEVAGGSAMWSYVDEANTVAYIATPGLQFYTSQSGNFTSLRYADLNNSASTVYLVATYYST